MEREGDIILAVTLVSDIDSVGYLFIRFGRLGIATSHLQFRLEVLQDRGARGVGLVDRGVFLRGDLDLDSYLIVGPSIHGRLDDQHVGQINGLINIETADFLTVKRSFPALVVPAAVFDFEVERIDGIALVSHRERVIDSLASLNVLRTGSDLDHIQVRQLVHAHGNRYGGRSIAILGGGKQADTLQPGKGIDVRGRRERYLG